jgi:hypothetical protein
MTMPGFTADLALNDLRGHYAIMPKDTFARSGLVIEQQLRERVTSTPLTSSWLELRCYDCYEPSVGRVPCAVYRVSGLHWSGPVETYLGLVYLPKAPERIPRGSSTGICWWECPERDW